MGGRGRGKRRWNEEEEGGKGRGTEEVKRGKEGGKGQGRERKQLHELISTEQL